VGDAPANHPTADDEDVPAHLESTASGLGAGAEAKGKK